MAEPAPTAQSAVDALVRLLDLERIEEDIFRGVSSNVEWQRVFGGQVAGQALVAAGRTVPDDRLVHSLHSYFVRPGDPTVPIVYEVDRVRDGRSFSTRRVIAVQHGKTIFSLSASFQLQQAGVDHQLPMPETPAPETVPPVPLLWGPSGREANLFASMPNPIDVRYVDDPPWQQHPDRGRGQPYRVWMRADGGLPDDPLVHVCVLTYCSDMTLLDSIMVKHGLSAVADDVSMASLDHAMWFQRPFRADQWLLYATSSPSASGGRGLGTGTFYTEDGVQVANVVQEGMIRVRARR